MEFFSNEEIRIPPPRLFGRGYLFDSKRQVVFITTRFLLWSTSCVEVPFSNIDYIATTESYREGSLSIHGGGSLDRYDFKILMNTSGVYPAHLLIFKVSVSTTLPYIRNNALESIEVNKGRETVTLIATAIGKLTSKPVRKISAFEATLLL